MTRITVNQPAASGEAFTPGCFDSQIGKAVSLNIPGGAPATAVIVAAAIAQGGVSVDLTLEVPDEVSSKVSGAVGGFSIA